MSSKMREALREAIEADRRGRVSLMSIVHEIAQRYGPFFSEREVRQSNDVLRSAYQIALRRGKDTNWDAFVKRVGELLVQQHQIMYPEMYEEHFGESESGEQTYGPAPCPHCESVMTGPHDWNCPHHLRHLPVEKEHNLDREVGELTKRVAAIEQRVLADGHSADCGYINNGKTNIQVPVCTCGHNEIREQAK